MLNGDGLRVVLWVAGCDHCCKECHNPVTWDPNGGLFFDEKAKAEIFEELEKDYISGITFSGGDPLHSANAYEVMMLAKEIKEKFPSKTIWLYTGYEWKDIKNMDIVNYLDVLVDGEFEVEKKELDLHWKGSANQMVINVPETLGKGEIVLHEENFILNAHLCLINEKGEVERISTDVFKNMPITEIHLVECSAKEIEQRMYRRDEISWDIRFIQSFLEEEKKYAIELSQLLNVTLSGMHTTSSN